MRRLLVVALLSAGAAFAADSDPGGVLRLPTPAGHVAADAAGEAPMQIAPLVDAAGGAAADAGPRVGEQVGFLAPRSAPRASWKLKGWFAPEEPASGREDIGALIDGWRLDSWRFDASVIRTF